MPILKLLIDHNANIEIPTDNGNTPIMWASFVGNTDTVKYLLEKNAVVTNLNNEGLSALDLAISRMHYDCALLLYKAGAKLRPVEEYKTILRFPYDIENFIVDLKQEREVPNASIYYFKESKVVEVIVEEGVDLVIDTRETWKEFFVRVWNFRHAPLVERADLPEDKQPHRSIYGKFICYAHGISPYPPPRAPGEVVVDDKLNTLTYQPVPAVVTLNAKLQEDEKEEEKMTHQLEEDISDTIKREKPPVDEKEPDKDKNNATDMCLQ